MIHSFSCKNFYSFGDETKIKFTVNKQAPNDFGYFEAPSGTRLSKVEAVVGPNASGKTNLLKVLPFLKWFINGSINLKPTDSIPVQQFMFGENKKTISLSVEFEIKKNVYIYSFLLDTNKVLEEELRIKNKSKTKVTSKNIFLRNWNPKKEQYSFSDKSLGLPKGSASSLRKNASVIGIGLLLNNKISQEIVNFWDSVETNVDEAGWIEGIGGDKLRESLIFFSDNDLLKKKAEEIMCRFDIGLDEIEIKTQKKGGDVFLSEVRAAHLFDGERQYLDFIYESSGTKRLLILLQSMLQTLSRGGIVILDEFEANLHPEIVSALIDLFIQPETNPKNAQILFSTHSHLLLSRLDKYQIVLVEKSEKGGSEAWRLDEMTGIRPDDNYYSKYIAGAYGAIPNFK